MLEPSLDCVKPATVLISVENDVFCAVRTEYMNMKNYLWRAEGVFLRLLRSTRDRREMATSLAFRAVVEKIGRWKSSP
jgi:hypothetical protein